MLFKGGLLSQCPRDIEHLCTLSMNIPYQLQSPVIRHHRMSCDTRDWNQHSSSGVTSANGIIRAGTGSVQPHHKYEHGVGLGYQKSVGEVFGRWPVSEVIARVSVGRHEVEC